MGSGSVRADLHDVELVVAQADAAEAAALRLDRAYAALERRLLRVGALSRALAELDDREGPVPVSTGQLRLVVGG